MVSWALGFLVFVPIPFLGALAAAIAMPAAYRSTARHGGVAAANARSAANWGITFGIVSIGLLVLHIIVMVMLVPRGGVSEFYPFGTAITLYLAVCVLHVVLVIIGSVRASQGKVMRVPFAIPFIRS